MKPKITIITVVLNQAEALQATIESVLEQSCADLAYIVIDGGSSDGTVDVIQSYADKLAYWSSEPDQGVYDAMNKGWEHADLHSWVLYLGAGDKLISLPCLPELNVDQNTVLYGNVYLGGNQVFKAKAGVWLKLYNSLHHQSLLVPKVIHTAAPFNLEFPLYADFDFNQRLMKAGVDFRFIPGLLAYASPGGLTAELRLEELLKIIRKNFGLFWACLAWIGFSLADNSAFIRRFRPIKKRVGC